MYALSATVTLMQLVELFFIAVLVGAYIVGAPRRVLLSLMAVVAALHIAYIAVYAETYNLSVHVRPFLDILLPHSDAHASAILDVAQVMAALAALDTAIHAAKSRRQAKHI